jgi:hypothetical protein
MKTFRSGEQVPASGIYLALHSTPHRAPERDMYFEGSRFPECGICQTGVLYRLESPCVVVRTPVMAEMVSAAC